MITVKRQPLIIALNPHGFQKAILTWFDQAGRKDLPWQQNKTPYTVWLSEIMLQQTQVATVIPYYLRFIERFPTLNRLAEAAEDEVLHYWTGLGYYQRARNLHRTAKIIVHELLGHFPHELSQLTDLPGIGRSTAGAILSIAFNQAAPILDGNVKRVLTRFYGITTWPGEPSTANQLWDYATQLTPKKRVADYTQAMMDLGATVCLRRKPKCAVCPLQRHCQAERHGLQETIPVAKPRKILPTRLTTFLILHQNYEKVFLAKRPPTGVWASLSSFPEVSGHVTEDAIAKTVKDRFGYTIKALHSDKPIRHTFSHFHLHILPAFIEIKATRHKAMEAGQEIWYNLQQAPALGLAAPVKLLLSKIPHESDDLLRKA